MKKIIDVKLDDFEKKIVESIESGEAKSIPNVTEEMKLFQKYAQDQIKKKKDDTLTLRISKLDKIALIEKAEEEGLPYQTLLTSIIHKYLTGRLIEARR